MTELHFDALRKFINTKCPMPGHWCNGEPIPLTGRSRQLKNGQDKLEPCKHYIPGVGCMHPDNPRRSKNKGTKRN